MNNDREGSDPTPEEIAERAKEVRATWKPEDRDERRVGSNEQWTPPYCSTTKINAGRSGFSVATE